MSAKAEALMGHQHESKPVTKADKAMSKIHKKHRKEIKKMMKEKGKDNPETLRKSIAYNRAHAQEHMTQLKKSEGMLHKLARKGALR